MEFGDHIRSTRKRLGMTQKTLARRAGYSEQYVCDIEHNRRQISNYMIEEFAEVLGVDVGLAYIWAGKMPPNLRDLGDERAKAVWDLLSKL